VIIHRNAAELKDYSAPESRGNGGGTQERLMQQVLNEEPVLPRRANREMPRDLAAIIRVAIAKDPRLRYRSAGEMAADLEAFAEQWGVPKGTVGYWRHLRGRKEKEEPRGATTGPSGRGSKPQGGSLGTRVTVDRDSPSTVM